MTMRQAFAHSALLEMPQEGDVAAPGAAITATLCGHWRHDGPCPISPHHTQSTRDGALVHIRTLFAAEPADEARIRRGIGEALSSGDEPTPWRLISHQPSHVRQDEAAHAARLVAAPAKGSG